jgi:hypothetical protein
VEQNIGGETRKKGFECDLIRFRFQISVAYRDAEEPQRQHGPEFNTVCLVRSIDPNTRRVEKGDSRTKDKSDQLVVHCPNKIRARSETGFIKG